MLDGIFYINSNAENLHPQKIGGSGVYEEEKFVLISFNDPTDQIVVASLHFDKASSNVVLNWQRTLVGPTFCPCRFSDMDLNANYLIFASELTVLST